MLREPTLVAVIGMVIESVVLKRAASKMAKYLHSVGSASSMSSSAKIFQVSKCEIRVCLTCLVFAHIVTPLVVTSICDEACGR